MNRIVLAVKSALFILSLAVFYYTAYVRAQSLRKSVRNKISPYYGAKRVGPAARKVTAGPEQVFNLQQRRKDTGFIRIVQYGSLFSWATLRYPECNVFYDTFPGLVVAVAPRHITT